MSKLTGAPLPGDDRPVELVRDRATRDVARQIFLNMGVAGAAAEVSVAADRIRMLVEAEVAAERDRCVRVCRERAELWRSTSATGVIGREEHRARANEATYLADLLASGEQPRPGSSPK